jgi:hypothetical protein
MKSIRWRLHMLWYRILRLFSKKRARAYLYALPPVAECLDAKRAEIARHEAETKARVAATGPTSCPKCSARIEREGDVWSCVGLADRDEVEQYLTWCSPEGKVPAFLTSRPPCGWTGKHEDFGRIWE